MEKIHCSVGILTYNSGKNLRRALESVKNFSNIIIADGGSTDDTLQIAAEYGAAVIDQYTKHHKGPNPHHPLADFARERNQLIAAATEDWYLWIDSDEYISDTLRDEIKAVVADRALPYHAYEIPIGTQSPDASVTYTPWRQNYQIRFFNLRTGGRFERAMHERFVFDTKMYKTGRLKGLWYVPLSKPDFTSYSRTVRYRLAVLIDEYPIDTFREYIYVTWYKNIRYTVGIFYRVLMSRLFLRHEHPFPLFYYRNQLYSVWVMFCLMNKKYFRSSKAI